MNRCRKLAGDWRRYEAAARRSLRPGSHATDLATYLATGIVGVREAAVARRRRLLAYVDWVRRRAATSTLSFAGPAVEGVALKSAEAPVVEGHERARLLLGDADQESPRATTPRSRVMQMLRRQRRSPRHRHASSMAWHTGSGVNGRAGRRRRARQARLGSARGLDDRASRGPRGQEAA